MSLRIAVFSDSINIPPKEGINVHTYALLKELASRKDISPILFVCDRGWLDRELLSKQSFMTVLVPENVFYDSRRVADLIYKYRIDIAQSYMTYFNALVLGPATYSTSVPMVSEFHDLEESVVPLYFAENEINEARHDHMSFQRQAAAYSTLVRTVSSFDLEIIKRTWPEYNKMKFFWMPVSVEVPMETMLDDKPDTVLYLGNMSYYPNSEGANIIQKNIAPYLKSGRRVTMIGRNSQVFTADNIDCLGPIDDLKPYLASTAVGLSPIVSGSGIKIKNLTYLRYGIPCLSTHFGANSFPETEAIIKEDDFGKWPAIIERLITDHGYRNRLSIESRRYFSAHFDIVANTDKLVSCYRKAIDNYPSIKNGLLTPTSAKYTDVDLRHVYWLRELRETGGVKVTEPLQITPISLLSEVLP